MRAEGHTCGLEPEDGAWGLQEKPADVASHQMENNMKKGAPEVDSSEDIIIAA